MRFSDLICNRHHAISLLLGNDLSLLNFFFNSERTDLNFGSGRSLLRNGQEWFDRDQNLLLRFGLDIWEAKSRLKIMEISCHLTEWEINAVMDALALLRTTGGCKCQNCCVRLGEKATWESPNILMS